MLGSHITVQTGLLCGLAEMKLLWLYEGLVLAAAVVLLFPFLLLLRLLFVVCVVVAVVSADSVL
jgi:hypothetical protein